MPRPVAKRDQPHQIGRYEIRRELGRGVMGVVYEAWDTILGRTIALKTIKPAADSTEQREAWERRFLIEARAAARLSHPAIVVVYDVGRDPDTDVLYIALEYLEGQSLAQKSVPGRPLPWRAALRIVGQVADGLHHAHTQGVIHRDVKPANVMILPSGDAKILDFGVARLDEGALTNPGDLCGTPLYMSPEQASGHTLDARSDIFSLGAVAWTLLTGQSPFDAPTVSAILLRVMHKAPPPPSEIVPGIPKDVDEILARALAKMPEDRYPDARQLAEDVEDALADRVPRHRAEWTPLAAGERTRVAPGAGDAHPATLAGDRASTAKAGRHHGRVWLGAALLLGLAVSAGVHFRAHAEDQRFWRELALRASVSEPAEVLRAWLRPSASVAPPTAGAATAWPAPAASAIDPAPDTIGASPTTAPADAGLLAGSGTTIDPHPGEPPAVPPDTLLPSDAASLAPDGGAARDPALAQPAPSPQPSAASATRGVASPSSPVTSPKEPRSPPKKASAFLSVGFRHRLKSGTLEVWVDGARVAREKLDSRATRKVLMLEVRQGSVQQTLPLAPGRHEVRIRVRSNGRTKGASTTAVFGAGATRRLEISLARLSGKVALEWR